MAGLKNSNGQGGGNQSQQSSGWLEKHSGILAEIDLATNGLLTIRQKIADLQAEAVKFENVRKELIAELDEGLGRVKKPAPGEFRKIKPKSGSATEALLKLLDDIGTASKEEIAEEMKSFSAGAIYQAILKLKEVGAIELLKDGRWGLTEAQQAAMRDEAAL